MFGVCFETCVLFSLIIWNGWLNEPIFYIGVETTNQMMFYMKPPSGILYNGSMMVSPLVNL